MKQLIDKLFSNIVRPNDGYEYLFSDDVYIPIYKYSLKITKRKIIKLNLVEEKVLEIVKAGVYHVEEISKILGIPRALLDITLADLHIKDLVTISSDKCMLLHKGEEALVNLQRVEKSQDIMKDIYIDALKGSIINETEKYQLLDKVWEDDNKLETTMLTEDLDKVKSQFVEIKEIFDQEYSQTILAEGVRSEAQELLTIDEIESVYVHFIRMPLHIFVSNNSLDIDIVAAKPMYAALLSGYKDGIIQQIVKKQVLKEHFKRKKIREYYQCEQYGQSDKLFDMIKNVHFSKSTKKEDVKEVQDLILASRQLMDGEVESILELLSTQSTEVTIEVDNLDDWAYDKKFVGKLSKTIGKSKLYFVYSECRNSEKALNKLLQGHAIERCKKADTNKFICWKYCNHEVYGIPRERKVLNDSTTCITVDYFLHDTSNS